MGSYYLTLLIIISSVAGAIFMLFFFYSIYTKRKNRRLLQLPLPVVYKNILDNVPLYQNLSVDEQKEINHTIMLFINTKKFMGVSLELSDEIKVVIAFHACLLLLHVKVSQCYENLSVIVVYPNTIIAEHVSNSGGIYTKGDFLLEGQSSSETVVLSWSDVQKDAYHLTNNNVVIHEFAHEIDFLDGVADGTPLLPYSKYHEWAKVLSHDFNRLKDIALKDRDWGKYSFIGSYAATNEAEFFAVISERYFENPKKLQKYFPQLYEELESFYQSKPIQKGKNYE